MAAQKSHRHTCALGFFFFTKIVRTFVRNYSKYFRHIKFNSAHLILWFQPNFAEI